MTSKYYYPTTHERGVDIIEGVGGGGGVVRYKAESISDLNMQRRRQQLEQTELELSERRARNMAIKVRSSNSTNKTSESAAKSGSVQNVAAAQARSYSNDSIDSRKSDDSWWSARDDSVYSQDKNKHHRNKKQQQQKQRIINYYDARDDDYESLDDGYYVYNDESGSRDSLGLYE